jgi:signal transduction histidine kinase
VAAKPHEKVASGGLTPKADRQMISVARSHPWAAALLLQIVALCTPLGAIAAETKRVLLLQSFGREIAPYDVSVDAFRSELAKGSSEPVAVYDASLDAEQASGSGDPEPFLEFLRRRFAASPPDVVVTIAPPAAAFFAQNRDKVFPGTPLVIALLDERFVRKSALRAGDAVVAIRLDLPALVKNILRVLPDTQTIAVVLGDSPLERFWLAEGRREFAQFANRIRFEWLNELSLEQMRQRVGALPPHSAVLYTVLISDAAGVPHEQRAALGDLAKVSTAPIFGLYESELGQGVVGGPYHSQQRAGALAAAAALRALSGQIAAEPVIQVVDYETPVYDWRELERWGIDLARLPAGSEIRFRPPSLWDEHRTLIATALSIFLLQAGLLIGLAWQRIRRRRAEGEALTLSGRLITVHEDERRWLARELHDDITQRLAGLAIDAAQLPGSGSSSTDVDPRRSIRGGLIRLSEDVHNLSYRLHPSVLDDLGLVEALKAECERVARVESIQVDVEAHRLPQSMPKEVALGIYRVAQEALRNIARHAKASTVRLSLALKDGGLLLTVTDNGSGFDPGVPARQPSVGHASMRERMRSLGGKLDIQSTPGMGTTVVAWVPIPKAPS